MHHDIPLGKQTDFVKAYTPALLFPIPRNEGRNELGIGEQLPFVGVDIWNHYEVSWLNAKGKPEVAVAQISVPAESRCLIESKSMKLYFNSLNFSRLDSEHAFVERVENDLSAVAEAPVRVQLFRSRDLSGSPLGEVQGINLDELDLSFDDSAFDDVTPQTLSADTAKSVSEQLCSHLLRSNCPVTHQPDWGSVTISYTGGQIDHEGLLRYIVSFRDHSEFHEHCVERIFTDIMARCKPTELTVYARYTRRGGLDINPYRSNVKDSANNIRLFRQ